MPPNFSQATLTARNFFCMVAASQNFEDGIRAKRFKYQWCGWLLESTATWQVVENGVWQITPKVSLSELDHDCTRVGNTVLRKGRLCLPAACVESQSCIQTFIRTSYTVTWPYTPFWSHPSYGPSPRVPRDGKFTVMKIMGVYRRLAKDSVTPPFPLSLSKWLLMEKNVSENHIRMWYCEFLYLPGVSINP